jgi:hypothetical protein
MGSDPAGAIRHYMRRDVNDLVSQLDQAIVLAFKDLRSPNDDFHVAKPTTQPAKEAERRRRRAPPNAAMMLDVWGEDLGVAAAEIPRSEFPPKGNFSRDTQFVRLKYQGKRAFLATRVQANACERNSAGMKSPWKSCEVEFFAGWFDKNGTKTGSQSFKNKIPAPNKRAARRSVWQDHRNRRPFQKGVDKIFGISAGKAAADRERKEKRAARRKHLSEFSPYGNDLSKMMRDEVISVRQILSDKRPAWWPPRPHASLFLFTRSTRNAYADIETRYFDCSWEPRDNQRPRDKCIIQILVRVYSAQGNPLTSFDSKYRAKSTKKEVAARKALMNKKGVRLRLIQEIDGLL